MTTSRQRPLWRCPRCGHEFVSRNLSHSCGRHSIDDHFAGKPEAVRRLFDALVRFVSQAGPSTCYAQKTRIVFQTRGRFLAVTPRREWLACHLWLKRRLSSPRYHRIDVLAGRDFVHHFRLKDTAELDEELLAHVRESRRVGAQERPRPQ
ncbi:MAG TPA: DUF5655 domain-containing protein [Gemmatimonadaceae bacterium]